MGHGDWGEKQVCSSSCNNPGGAWCYIYTPSHEFINRWMVQINSCPSLSPYSFQSNPWGRDSTLLPRPPLPPRSSPTPPVSARPKPLPTPPPTVAVIVSSPPWRRPNRHLPPPGLAAPFPPPSPGQPAAGDAVIFSNAGEFPRPTLAPTVGLHHLAGSDLAAQPHRHLRRVNLPPRRPSLHVRW
jgi:hypothetical protein